MSRKARAMGRRWRSHLPLDGRILFLLSLFLGVALLLTGDALAQSESAGPSLRNTRDFRFSSLRTGLALTALAAFVGGHWLRRGTSAERARVVQRVYLAVMVVLALAAYASYYQFFQVARPDGFASPDNFHYYVGSKYFSELGYFGLYECSLRALDQRGTRVLVGQNAKARDLRTMRERPAQEIKADGADCQERFSPERWRAFSRDVGFFIEKWPAHLRNAVWSDHGYHPTPVWTWFGGRIAGLASTDSARAMGVLLRADRILIALTLLGVAWAFGLEVGCLAAIVWGTGHLWRYTWVGDAFLRHLWWIATFVGLIGLRRGLGLIGGVGLTLAAALRIFPGAFGGAYLIGAARRYRDGDRSPRNVLNFAVGAITTTALLGLGAAIGLGQGLAPYTAFASKIGEFTAVSATNKMGLAVALDALLSPGPLAAALRFLGVAAFGWLFWRGLKGAELWESAAYGFALIPLLSSPTNYYFSFFVMGTTLAARRPLIGGLLLATNVAWGINGLAYYRTYTEFPAASWIAVLSITIIAIAMTRPPRALTDLPS